MSQSDVKSAAARYLRKLSHGVAGARTGAVEAATAEALSRTCGRSARASHPDDRARDWKAGGRAITGGAGEALPCRTASGPSSTLKNEGRERASPAAARGCARGHRGSGRLATHARWSRRRMESTPRTRPSASGRGWRRSSWTRSRRSRPPSAASISTAGTGDGFVCRDGLILTNRHVLQGLATQGSAGEWEFRGQPSITFDAKPADSRSRQFKIRKKVVLAGPEAIDRH